MQRQKSGLIKALERTDAIDILIYVLEHEPITRSTLFKEGYNRNTVRLRINELTSAGLLREEPSDSFPYEIKIYLTEKGRKVAEILKKLKVLENKNKS
ncbi:MAG: winged helix-turn-helix transcriptional regulator [Candidatus Asgardarchaeum sp.]